MPRGHFNVWFFKAPLPFQIEFSRQTLTEAASSIHTVRMPERRINRNNLAFFNIFMLRPKLKR